MDVVAEEELTARFPNGRVAVVRVRLGRPCSRPTGEWACPVALEGVPGWEGPHEILGEGSLQALTLGLRFLRSGLDHALVKGIVFQWPNSPEPVDFDLLFWPESVP